MWTENGSLVVEGFEVMPLIFKYFTSGQNAETLACESRPSLKLWIIIIIFRTSEHLEDTLDEIIPPSWRLPDPTSQNFNNVLLQNFIFYPHIIINFMG